MSCSIPAAVIMGKSGVGKTTFYNKLCETDHEATYSSKSLTRQLYRSEVTHGANRFTVIDTPGTDSRDEVFKHSFLLKEALTSEPINTIFALVQYNDRCDSALEEFDKTISYLKPEYRRMVVVIVSKFDSAPREHSKQIQAEYKEQFEEEGFPKIMFHSKDMSALSVATEMLGFMKEMPQKQMKYEEEEFLAFFRVADESRAQKKVVGKLEADVHKILQGYKEMLHKLGSIEDKDDIIMTAIASSRYEVDEVYDGFNKEFGERMVDLDCYTTSIALQKTIESAHRAFRLCAKELMSYDPDDSKDWKNCIRKCEHCGEVWVKVSGCEGTTTCGNRDANLDVSGRPWFRYLFSFDSRGLCSWTKNTEEQQTKARKVTSSTSEKAKGCGKSINWSNQPRLSREELAKCLEVKGLDNIISTMQGQPKFREAVAGYVKSIDASFTK